VRGCAVAAEDAVTLIEGSDGDGDGEGADDVRKLDVFGEINGCIIMPS
jgi:hypothetical protein